MTRPQLAPRPVREPATLLARPSALAFTRIAWAVFAAVIPVVLTPSVGRWCPWLAVPLLASALVDAGIMCAVMWGLVGLVVAAVLPPGGDDIAPQIIALLCALALTRRARSLTAASSWAPAVVGAAMVVTHDLALVVLDAASSGHVQIDVTALAVRGVLTAVLAALVVPAWVAWADRERSRGRA